MWIFRQLFDPVSSTYTYLLADQGQAVLIDTVFEQVPRDSALLRELGLTLVATLDTHVHADHVTGAWLHRQRSGCEIVLSAAAGAAGATRSLSDRDRITFGSRYLQARSTPGHTSGCMSYVLDDNSMVFTGDALLIRGCGRTDFQQGSAPQLFESVHRQILGLPAACLVYPAHDYRGLTVSSVDEERRFNPRLGGDASAEDFAGYMAHLGLPHPKLIDLAVPANLRCGEPADGQAPPEQPTWAPLTYSFGGVWELSPEALEERLQRVQVLDVREMDEFSGALGRIPGARLMPMAQLAQWLKAHPSGAEDEQTAAGPGDPLRPLVTVCRSGARSAQAYQLLHKAGWTQVANLAGGMLRWRAQGHAVAGGQA